MEASRDVVGKTPDLEANGGLSEPDGVGFHAPTVSVADTLQEAVTEGPQAAAEGCCSRIFCGVGCQRVNQVIAIIVCIAAVAFVSLVATSVLDGGTVEYIFGGAVAYESARHACLISDYILLKGFKAQVDRLKAENDRLTGQVDLLTQQNTRFAENNARMEESLGTLDGHIASFNELMGRYGGEMEEAIGDVGDAVVKLAGMSEAIERMLGQFQNVADRQAAEVDRLGSETTRLGGEIDRVTQVKDMMEGLYSKSADFNEAHREKVGELVARHRANNEEQAKLLEDDRVLQEESRRLQGLRSQLLDRLAAETEAQGRLTDQLESVSRRFDAGKVKLFRFVGLIFNLNYTLSKHKTIIDRMRIESPDLVRRVEDAVAAETTAKIRGNIEGIRAQLRSPTSRLRVKAVDEGHDGKWTVRSHPAMDLDSPRSARAELTELKKQLLIDGSPTRLSPSHKEEEDGFDRGGFGAERVTAELTGGKQVGLPGDSMV